MERQIVECLEFIGALPCWNRNARGFVTKGRKKPTDEGMSHCIEKLERIKHLYIIGDMAQKEYEAERQRIHLELEGEVHSSAYYGDRIFALLSHFGERWDAASKLERNIMLQAILEKGWVDHGRIVAIELKPVVHRYLLGNPVLSVYQIDIILHGYGLPSYFHNEFGVPLPE